MDYLWSKRLVLPAHLSGHNVRAQAHCLRRYLIFRQKVFIGANVSEGLIGEFSPAVEAAVEATDTFGFHGITDQWHRRAARTRQLHGGAYGRTWLLSESTVPGREGGTLTNEALSRPACFINFLRLSVVKFALESFALHDPRVHGRV